MRVKKIGAAAIFTIAAMGIAGGVAHADPAPGSTDAVPYTVHGAEHGVAFEISRSADGKSLAANLSGGTFTVTESALNITDPTGAVVASVPLTIEFEQGTVDLRPQVDATGTHLTAEPIGTWHQSSPKERSSWSGAALGGFIGATLGMLGILGGPLVIVTFLGGALIGGLIGYGIGAAIPNSDIPDRWDYIEPQRSDPPSIPGCYPRNALYPHC
ncbi:hypothetical protein [Nocardia arthritidis]|uniref:DUF8020 domain-containing protein n=1 Tax=Nocardia arthritidis TaxID=228602 RepID=A0A6G9YS94_9NOCA|nr:hypothetical protein [Nocardia arthritidis]QIS16185.1 hypothetical protein F5544_41875 [Nocardia arthritidis]